MHRALNSGQYVLGEEVERFERAFANYCDVAHGIGVGSGTDALTLALKAFDIGSGDEVITVAHTALATVAAIVDTGARPVLVDVHPRHRTLDPSKLDTAITPHTRAIMPVHLYGAPADMGAIMDVARRHGLVVIEDCAQAGGARHRGRRVGSLADAGCFSFYPTKNLAALGDGGLVITNDARCAERLRRLRQYGWDESRYAKDIGRNSRLDVLQAAILAAKLPSLDDGNARRRAIARRYNEGLAGLPLNLPLCAADGETVFHLYVIESPSRAALIGHLAARGVGTGIHYEVPVHRHAGYARRVTVPPEGLPVTDRLAAQVLSLPIYPELSDDDVDRVIAAMRSFFT